MADIHQRSDDELLRLADRCELAAPMEHAEMLVQAGFLAAEHLRALNGARWSDQVEEALRLVRLGASESAVLALIPPMVDVTAGTFGGRSSLIAQAFVPGWGKSHSRRATSLAMAWLAAFLRALAQGGTDDSPRDTSGRVPSGSAEARAGLSWDRASTTLSAPPSEI